MPSSPSDPLKAPPVGLRGGRKVEGAQPSSNSPQSSFLSTLFTCLVSWLRPAQVAALATWTFISSWTDRVLFRLKGFPE